MQVKHEGTRARRGFGALAALALSAFAVAVLLTAPVSAAAESRYTPVTGEVPITFAVTGDEATDAPTFTATMTAADGEEIAPDQASVTVTGAGEAVLSATFDEVGEHHYTVTQTAGSAKNWTYDTQVYDVTIYCMWEESTDSLFTTVIIKDAEGYKADDCTFTNSYKAPAKKVQKKKGTLAHTGDDSGAYIAAALGAGVIVVCAGVVLRRRRNDD